MPPKRDPALLAKLRERQRQARGVRTSKYAQNARREKKFKEADVDTSVDLAAQLMKATGHSVGSKQKKQLENIIQLAAEFGPEAALQKMGVKDKTMIEKIMRGMDEFSKDVKEKTNQMNANDHKDETSNVDRGVVGDETKEDETAPPRRKSIQPPKKKEKTGTRKPIQPPTKKTDE